MKWPAVATYVLFLLLWLGPLFAVRLTERRGGRPANAVRAALGLYSLAFIALAFWWRVPFSAQQAVESAASSWAAATRGPIDCAEIRAGAAALGRVSQGQIEATGEGRLRVSAVIWQRLPAPQRATLVDLAGQIRRCLSGNPQEAAIYDIETNRILHEAGRQ